MTKKKVVSKKVVAKKIVAPTVMVRATRKGFDGFRRRDVGDKFLVEEKYFKPGWQEKVQELQEHDEDVEVEVDEPGEAPEEVI